MSDVDLIRDEANRVFGDLTVFQRRSALKRLLTLLDGVTGLAREGDVVLSAEQVAAWRDELRAFKLHQLPLPLPRELALRWDGLLASDRPGEEQA